MNNKGFTMVELLVAMAIMGLLMIMAFPTMRAVQLNNQKKKYESYGESVLSAAKLYTDSYSEDLFDPTITNQFKTIYLTQIVKKGLLKDINISDSTCINGESNIVIVKYKNDYSYCIHLTCTSKKDTDNILYETEKEKGSCTGFKRVDVVYNYNGEKKIFEVISGDDDYRVLYNNTLQYNYSSNKDVLLKWKDSKNIEYNPGDIIGYPIPETGLTLTAKTRKFKYRVRYASSLAGTTGAVDEHDCTYGQECKLKDNKFEKDYYQFTNWTYNSKNYNEKEDVKDKIGKTITVDNQLINISSVFRKNKLSIVRYSEGGVLTPSDSQDCPKTAKCPKDRCDWHNGGDSEYCTGKPKGHIYTGAKIFFDGTNFAVYGLKDYCNEGSLYSTRTGYNCTGNWLIGSNTSSVKIHENKLYSKNLDFVKDCKGDYDKLLKKGDITINTYAEWTPKTITVTYDCTGGTGGGSETFTYDVSGQKFGKKCTKDGYHQTGWRFKDDTTKKYNVDNGISNAWIDKYSSSITLYATWSAKTLDVKFDCDGGSGGGTETFIYGKSGQKFSKKCTKEGYHQTGWRLPSDSAKRYEIDNGVSNAWIKEHSPSTILYATYDKNICKVTYDPNGGRFNSNSTNTTQTLKYGESTTNTMRNAQGETYNATRDNYYIDPSRAWISGDRLFNQEKNYTALDFCPGLKTSSQNVTLHVNWGMVKKTKAFWWRYKKSNCNHDNGKHNKFNNVKGHPYRTYKFKNYRCWCKMDPQTGLYTGSLAEKGTDNKGYEFIDDHKKYGNDLATVYYTNGENGEAACRGLNTRNQKVYKVCHDSGFSYTDTDNNIGTENGTKYIKYHGYVFYKENLTNPIYNKFGVNFKNNGKGIWLHQDGNLNEFGDFGTPTKENIIKGCNFACGFVGSGTTQNFDEKDDVYRTGMIDDDENNDNEDDE